MKTTNTSSVTCLKFSRRRSLSGAVYRHYAGAHVQSVVASHSYLNNRNTKYQQNDESDPEHLMLRLRSTEQNTQLRLENSSSFRNWKVTVGTSLDYSQYSNTTFQKVYTDRAQTFDYHTYLGIMRWGLFGTVNYTSIDERFTASLGLRADANNYSAAMKDLSDQLSPRPVALLSTDGALVAERKRRTLLSTASLHRSRL